MMIRTKILATIGPASSSREQLRRLFDAGCDLCRINFSHGSEEQHEASLKNIREVEEEIGWPIAVCADLCGPKIRVGMMQGGGVLLAEGQEVVIQREAIEGSPGRISTTLPELVDDVQAGEILLMDDGKLRLEVVETRPPDEVACRVIVGGILGSGKGVNLPRTQLRLSALTEKDRNDAAWIAQHDFDYVALSFVQRADDVHTLRALLAEHGSDAHIIAKIEKPQALDNFDEILEAVDGIMVARGDLGVEMEPQSVPIAQKRITAACQKAGKPCIIATQMLESMISCPTPTRAEVSDVANAVLDHADAVMLSGETAVGKYPVEAVRIMNATVQEVQEYHDETCKMTPVHWPASPTTAAIAAAVREIITQEDITAIAVYTATGATARMISKNRPPVPILAFAPDIKTVRRMCLYYGVVPHQADAPMHTRDVLNGVSRFAKKQGIAKEGERIVVVSGRPIGVPGHTNTIVIHTVGQEVTE